LTIPHPQGIIYQKEDPTVAKTTRTTVNLENLTLVDLTILNLAMTAKIDQDQEIGMDLVTQAQDELMKKIINATLYLIEQAASFYEENPEEDQTV
jgi:hypothetical protein